MKKEDKNLTLKNFWNEVVVPTIKEWLPDILKFFFKHWGTIFLATITVVSTGGFIYEKIAYDTLRASVDSAYTSVLSDLNRLKSEFSIITTELETARNALADSTRTVEKQREIIQSLQNTNRRLTEIYNALNQTGGAIESGERELADLIEHSLRINRDLQTQIGILAGAGR